MTATRPGSAVAVLTVVMWALLLTGALGFVTTYGSNVPTWDDWDIVPVLTREQPITLPWLWSEHNEHRVPLPRLLMIGLNRATTIDLRVEMVFDVLIMGAVALGMILIARRIRGRASYADVFFPVIVLSWGQAPNLIWAWQLQFFSSAALAGVILLFIVRAPARAALANGIVWAAGLTVLLPLCGANGLGMTPALALWPMITGWRLTRDANEATRRNGWIALGLGCVALLLAGLYFVGYEPVPYHPKGARTVESLKTAAKFIAMGLGPAARAAWPWSGIATLALILLSLAFLAFAWRERPGDRDRITGLALFLGALGSLALGVGLGRHGFETRYVTLAIPLWCALYFVNLLYAPRPASIWLQRLLVVGALMAFWPNTRSGYLYASGLRRHLAAFERRMAAGVPSHELLCREGEYLHVHHDVPTDYLPMLKRHRVGRFAGLQLDPVFREVPVSLRPVSSDTSVWKDGAGRQFGLFQVLEFSLPQDTYAAGIRLRYNTVNREPAPFVAMFWKRGTETDFTPEHYKKYSPTGDRGNWVRGAWTRVDDPHSTMTAWVCDTVRDLRIAADVAHGPVLITGLTVLAPPARADSK